jgi:hypothetical protein
MTNQTTRKMAVLMLASICSALVPQIGTAFAQNPYTICIGDLCHSPSYINLGCSFAGSHKDSTDEDAAKLVCMVRNKYEKYTFVRTAIIKGGRCGAIYVQVRCSDEKPVGLR